MNIVWNGDCKNDCFEKNTFESTVELQLSEQTLNIRLADDPDDPNDFQKKKFKRKYCYLQNNDYFIIYFACT